MKKPNELDLTDFDDSEEQAQAKSNASRLKPGQIVPFYNAPIDPAVAAHYDVPVDIVNSCTNFQTRSDVLRPYALKMYCDYYPQSFIGRSLGLGVSTVRGWKQAENWDEKRSAVERHFAGAIAMSRLKQTMTITCDAIDIIGKVLAKTKKDPDLGIRDAEAVSRILSNLDKIVRLSTGAPTEITESRDGTTLRLPRNAQELAEILKGDPFIDVTPEKADKPEDV